ncbi:hypothetical protein, partial [Acinetobacter schindleri]|uniref:hypothetical protein n=1 Tax=Acinetobacter schindleri TaxID=108981 RepID=UPI001BB3FE27
RINQNTGKTVCFYTNDRFFRLLNNFYHNFNTLAYGYFIKQPYFVCSQQRESNKKKSSMTGALFV